MADASLLWKVKRLRGAVRHRVAGGFHVPEAMRHARGYGELISAGLAYWSGSRLNITKAGEGWLEEQERRLAEAGEVGS